ncbi:MAG TPA: hypothetical protein DCE48_09260 [Lachnospiraceae bacterium]|uniref:hypothetical protein n=1 Tax=Anaerosporobacter sp. TaxID=1872529 RepID=UPI000EDAE0A7|nr:hypothetical protein [Anaerosporobacter sp.]HAB60876.1 hypothetical protein [Lachnospiraceae bacterium]
MNAEEKRALFQEIEQNREEYKQYLYDAQLIEDQYHEYYIQNDKTKIDKKYNELQVLYKRKEVLDKRWKELHQILDNLIKS